jgi:hypothetical protein
MWRITTADGRRAVFCGDDRAALEAMVIELFGGLDGVEITRVA